MSVKTGETTSMASRRDELNAYTFARKRTVGAFLQPSGGGNDEDAPKPVRAVLPSVVVAAVIVAGFGMAGVIKPSAPKGWDDGKNIIQGKDSTTRYVVLIDSETHAKVLHQVLNMSSAKLVLPAGSKVVPVADSVLDAYPNHGATIGIPYAPDKLPKSDDAGVAKKWSVCDRPGKGEIQATINQAVFVAADAEAKKLASPDLVLSTGQSLYVQAPKEAEDDPGSEYLIDPQGRKHAVGNVGTSDNDRTNLRAALFGSNAKPQQVTKEWLDTLEAGDAILFPKIEGFQSKGVTSNVQLTQKSERKVGRLLQFQNNSFYVVGVNKLFEISAFQAELIRYNPELQKIYEGTPKFADLPPGDYAKLQGQIDTSMRDSSKNLPQEKPAAHPVNFNGSGKGRTVLCSTFESMEGQTIKRSVWAHTDYPAPVTSGAATAHVSPGHGLLFRSVDGSGTDSSGSNFLITETGLRYSVPSNNDGKGAATPSPDPQAPQGQQQEQGNEAASRLGFEKVQPTLVPHWWADLVPAGPVLNTKTALQAQTA